MAIFKDQLRDALRNDLRLINQDSLQRPTLPPPAPHPQRAAVIGVAAAVVAVTMAAGIVVMLHRNPASTVAAGAASEVTTSTSTSAASATPAVTLTAGAITVQGAVIPVPHEWHTQDLTDSSTSYQFCVLPRTMNVDPAGCLSSRGILIRIARVTDVHQAQSLTGTFEADCGKYATVPKLEPASVGPKPGDKITVSCGSRSAPSTTYWQVSDRTLTIQTPFDGTGTETADLLVQQIDLSRWLHYLAAASSNTAGSSPATGGSSSTTSHR